MAAFKGTLIDKLRAKVAAFISSDNYIVYSETYLFSDIPANGLVTKQMLGGATATVTRVPFSWVNGYTINWQTDIIPGSTEPYATVYGNYVEAFVYFSGSPAGQPYTWTVDGNGNVLVVTFDWGTSQTGYILFR